jgi:hypothetical protein
MLSLRICGLKTIETRWIKILPSPSKHLGFQLKSVNRMPNLAFRGQGHTQRCTIHPPMIPSKKFEQKFKSTNQAMHENPQKMVRKRTWKLHELREGNQRNGELFHSTRCQILHKVVEKFDLDRRGIRKQCGWMSVYTLQEILWSMTKFPWRFLISLQITLHPWQTLRFRHRLAVLDMKPDMKSKHYDVVPISS